LTLSALLAFSSVARAGSEDAPLFYGKLPAHDPITRLQYRLDHGQASLQFDDRHGYLESVLNELHISPSTQSLVFSKTSFQRELISSHRPRAIYFNDDVYVGFVRDGSVLEVATIDNQQGTTFYTISQEQREKPRFNRLTSQCLQCHESETTRNIPGLLMRSIYPDELGRPLLAAGSYHTTDQSPFRQRWGGWYVTGTHGSMRHMGNVILEDEQHPETFDRDYGANLTDLSQRFQIAPYLTPDSDIVALMVLTHQANVHNLMTQASYEVRSALSDQFAINEALHQPVSTRIEGTDHRIASACEPLVTAMLFSGEAAPPDPIAGTSKFTTEFSARGPADRKGRSLRQFDLTHRLFKYPCSYLIYSPQFDGLPAAAREYIYRRLLEVLSGKDQSAAFKNLSLDDRQAILQILRETKAGLPEAWGAQSALNTGSSARGSPTVDQ
jgi:hypothetical protein